MGSSDRSSKVGLELARSCEFVLEADADPLVLTGVLGGTHTVYKLVEGAWLVVMGAISVGSSE